MNYLEIRAEALKQTEIVTVRDGERGSYPRSVRKRGYHRALKRGEIWAIADKKMTDTINEVLNFLSKEILNNPEKPAGIEAICPTCSMPFRCHEEIIMGSRIGCRGYYFGTNRQQKNEPSFCFS